MRLSRPKRIPRLLGTSVTGLVIAGLLTAQALSSVFTRSSPELALRLVPTNGLAREQFAFTGFSARVAEPGDESAAAVSAASDALLAFRDDPLVPKAHAILALAQKNETVKRQILDAAYSLNRRDLALQGLVLKERVAEKDYPGTLETLDQIMRVHARYSRDFFPLLTDALAEEETIPLFADMLDGTAAWHERFLNFAVNQKEILPNLAKLRLQIGIGNEQFDSRLVSGLAGTGDIAGAATLVRELGGQSLIASTHGPLDWRSNYPPFEWEFVDEPGFRAQASLDEKRLELSVRPGKGGIIAARMIETPETPFAVSIVHRIAPADQARDARLQLMCLEQSTPFFDERFGKATDIFRIGSVPAGCDYFVLTINARAWSGRSALGGTIDRIEIVEGT